MSREKELAKNTLILSIGTFLPKLFAMITLPLLTEYLSVAEYGIYDLITTLVSLLLPAVTLQIQSAAFRFLIETRDSIDESQNIVTNIFVFTIPVSVIALIILVFSFRNLDVEISFAISVYFFLDILLVSIRQIARGIGDNIGFALDSITNAAVMLLLTFIGLVVLKKGLLGVVFALSGATCWSVFFLSLRIKIWKYINIKKVSIKKLKKLLAYSWPMVPNNLSGWILNLSDRLVITLFIGVEANAVYAVANKIPNLLKTFQSTFTFAWQESASLSVDDKDSDEYYTKMVEGLTCLLTGGMACLIAATPVLFKILIRGNYDAAYYQIPILYLGAFFSVEAGVLGGIYIAHMKTKNVGITTILAAICNLLIDFLLIKKVGIYAGSISTLVSYLLLTVYRMYNIKKFQNITYNYKIMLGSCFFLVMMSMILYQQNFGLNIVNVMLAVLINFIFNKKIILSVLRSCANKLKRKY